MSSSRSGLGFADSGGRREKESREVRDVFGYGLPRKDVGEQAPS